MSKINGLFRIFLLIKKCMRQHGGAVLNIECSASDVHLFGRVRFRGYLLIYNRRDKKQSRFGVPMISLP